ncbi:MAG: hypothetical protein MAG451_01280 [Anaerolineales bacterium]|nr:hypothetical protein [Anaerolineales bacterium]
MVEVQSVGKAVVVLWEGAAGLWDLVVQIDVGSHEEVGPAVVVQVAHDGGAVPLRRGDAGGRSAFGEGAVAVVPEQRVRPVSGDVEVPPAILVEISGDAAVAPHCQIGTRRCTDVGEGAAIVAVQRVAREAALLLPEIDLVLGVRVDEVEVQPAVVVVVDPAEGGYHVCWINGYTH